jgi:hypothetical protein
MGEPVSGMDVGRLGETTEMLRSELAKRGVAVSQRTIRRWRHGTPTRGMARRSAAADLLDTTDVSRKTECYLQLANIGANRRSHPADEGYVWRSNGFTAMLAQELGCSEAVIRRCLHAMRADVLLWILEYQDLKTLWMFDNEAWSYLYIWLDCHRRSHLGDAVFLLEQAWRADRVLGFYRQLYDLPGQKGVPGWVPYELWSMRRFYEQQVKDGCPLTPFDQMVLDEMVDPQSRDVEFQALVQERTGVVLTQHSLACHRNVLLYGTPVSRRGQHG